jgi:hypothetical protein
MTLSRILAPRCDPELDSDSPLKAVRLLGARDLHQARRLATMELMHAKQNGNPLARVFERIGSTLFFDDDPEQLMLAFNADSRDGMSPRLLAACIVLFGRPRLAAQITG